MDWSRHPKIQRAADAMWAGEVIAYPTEGVWGLGCAPHDEHAVCRLLAIKRRAMDKGLILVAANVAQLGDLYRDLSDAQKAMLNETWPGPVTWLIPNNGSVPEWITGDHPSVAVRVSAHPLVSGLCKAFGGPVVSTSANPQGLPPAMNRLKVKSYFRPHELTILPGSLGKQTKPSEIRDLQTGRIIRAG